MNPASNAGARPPPTTAPSDPTGGRRTIRRNPDQARHAGRTFVERAARTTPLMMASLAAAAVAVWAAWDLIPWILAAGVAAALMSPLFQSMRRVVPATAAAAVAVAVGLVALVLPLAAIGFLVAGDVQDVAAAVANGQARASMVEALEAVGLANPEAAAESIMGPVEERVYSTTPMGFVLKPTLLVGATIMVFLTFWFVRDGALITDGLLARRPDMAQRARKFIGLSGPAVRAVVGGQVLASAAKGAAVGIGLWFFGVPHAALWGLVAAVFTLLPVVTAWMVWGPAALWLAANGQVGFAIGLALWGAIVAGSIDNLVRPIVVGKATHQHPALVLIAMIAGVTLFGFVGAFIGPAVAAVAREFIPRRAPQGHPAYSDPALSASRPDPRAESWGPLAGPSRVANLQPAMEIEPMRAEPPADPWDMPMHR